MDVDIPCSEQVNALINKSNKSSSLTCLVCGSSATGFNFSVITCMCCKAFFRRNALYGLHSYQCRYSTGECTINMLTRRDCSYCRLKKCFQVGMKKELILTDDVKRLKREKILANRKLTISNGLDLNTYKNFLSGDDFILLRNISNVYEEHCRLPIMSYEKREYELICQQPLKTRIKSQHYLESFQKHSSSLNNFFQHIPDLQVFPSDERKILLSHNTRFLMRLNSVETLDDSFPLWGAARLLIEIMYGKSIMDNVDQCLHQFRYHLNDSRCTQLMLIILLFSTSINYQGNLNTLVLYKLQEKYLRLLWSYLERRFGSVGACEKFSLIIRYCLRLQAIGHLMEVKIQDVQWQDILLSTQQINID